jgi:hypothetical protein
VRPVELSRNLQVRSGEPDPLAADIVHVREDRGDGADSVLAGRFRSPGGRVKMFDQNLVHALIGGKDLDCGLAKLSVNLGSTSDNLTRAHGSLLLDPSYVRGVGKPEAILTTCVAGLSLRRPKEYVTVEKLRFYSEPQ